MASGFLGLRVWGSQNPKPSAQPQALKASPKLEGSIPKPLTLNPLLSRTVTPDPPTRPTLNPKP